MWEHQSARQASPQSPFLPLSRCDATRVHVHHGKAQPRRVPAARPFLFPSRQCHHIPLTTPPLPHSPVGHATPYGAGATVAQAVGVRGQAASGLRGASCGHLRLCTNLLVLPHQSPAAASPSPAATGRFPGVLCFKFASGTPCKNSTKGRGLTATCRLR